MVLTAQAVYKDGQLKLTEALALAEGTPVQVTITPLDQDNDPLAAVIGICDDGPPVSLAERHDEFTYGLKPHGEAQS